MFPPTALRSRPREPLPSRGARWRRLATTVLGAGLLSALLLLTLLAVAYFLPVPMLVVPVAAATAAVAYVTVRSRRSEAGPRVTRAPAPATAATTGPPPAPPTWPTGRRRRVGAGGPRTGTVAAAANAVHRTRIRAGAPRRNGRTWAPAAPIPARRVESRGAAR